MLDIDPSTVEIVERQDYQPIPNGTYVVSIEEAIDQSNLISKAGDKYSKIKITYNVLEGEYANRKVWSEHMYEHARSDTSDNIMTALKLNIMFLAKVHKAASCEGNITPPGLMTGGAFKAKVVLLQNRVNKQTGESLKDRNDVTDVFALDRNSSSSQTQHTPF